MNRELYIDGQLVDLSEDSNIALTFQINNIADLQSRNGNFSNKFKVPFTQNNHIIFGYSNNITSSSDKPYSKLSVKYVEEGIEVISAGYAIIDQTDTYYNVVVYSNNADFFDLIDGRNLKDLDFSDCDHNWYYTDIILLNTNTDKIIYPIIDYGFMLSNLSEVACKEMFPAIFKHTIVKRIVEAVGWTLEGDIITDNMYLNDLVAWSNNKWANGEDLPEETIQQSPAQVLHIVHVAGNPAFTGAPVGYGDYSPPFLVKDNSAQIIYENGISGDIEYGNFKTDLSDGNVYWVPPIDNNDVNVTATVDFTYSSGAAAGGGAGLTYNMMLVKINAGVITQLAIQNAPSLLASGQTNFPIHLELNNVSNYQLAAGDKLALMFNSISYFQSGGSGTGATWAFDLDFTITSIDFKVTHVKDIYEGTLVQMSKQLPDMSQKDFLKGVMNQYGISPDAQSWNQTLKFRQFTELTKNLPKAKNWSKLVGAKNSSIKYRIGNYNQRNKCTWDVDKYTTKELGNAYFNIADKTLNPGTDINASPAIQLPFGSSDMVNRLQFNKVYVPFISKLQATYNNTNDVQLQLNDTSIRSVMLSKDMYSGAVLYKAGGAVSGHVSSQSVNIPYCFFSLPGQDNNLDWANLLKKFYPEILDILNKLKMPVEYVFIKSKDVQNFDHFIPVYIEKYAANFYVNRITNFKSGQPTQVELIRI